MVVDVDVVVVGAGISGLTAAYTILTRDPGIRLVVIEAKGTSYQSKFIDLGRIYLKLLSS